MSRQAALVSADWVEQNKDSIVLIEVDEDVSAYDGGHIAGAIKLCTAATTTGSPRTRTGTSSCTATPT